ncbi:magnesium-translocating P-type ATPase [Mesoplasma lactucae]|uniref:Magnesium-transporting ATPase, P-type 1 n=1 Tax=Mesoplasma lactucae ATCC 49193 TaxID=81460 RepID=A0A291IRV3_9MOLU|nr:magnesium-translocating P-type ATPase [Mesoplasma lactucae]ATG97592.1 magnesium-translocating P-type ATPase [Mesoplasma lactucae ATCC 49193]ATZ19948.1 Mg(2+) transport ATPase, P-type [Mesoplasma lactucae ATCC 49193]MCL8217101.1 Magnesium-transporting ATPase, P-type 1 [Mesoplasma lactucae ATCC 49193]
MFKQKRTEKRTPAKTPKTKKGSGKTRFSNEAELKNISQMDQTQLLEHFDLNEFGLTNEQYEEREEKYGKNEIDKQHFHWWREFVKNYFGPFNIILILISIYNFFSYFSDSFAFDGLGDKFDLIGAILVLLMVIISGTISYIQTIRTYYSTKKISSIVESTTNIIRRKNDDKQDFSTVDKNDQLALVKLGEEMDVKDLVPGDLIYLSSGDMVPADVRIVMSTDLFINQSSLTGESLPVEKHATSPAENNILDLQNICYTGTSVVSGSAIALVVATGTNTYFAAISKAISDKRPEGGFQKGVKSVTRVLIVFMLIMVPIVYLINGGVGYARTGDSHAWLKAVFFAVAVAVGLTPEMLPLIVTTNLANGATKMAKQKVVVKELDAIQALGAIDILATDKTGTLTNDKIDLIDYQTVDKKSDEKLLKYLYINSYFQTGLKSPMDVAVIDYVKSHNYNFNTHNEIKKVDEIPFDFNRRKLTIVADIKGEGTMMVTKGSMEEVLESCNKVYYQGKVVNKTKTVEKQISAYYEAMNNQGKRVLGVAVKPVDDKKKNFTPADEKDLIFVGFATFQDTPKPSTAKMIKLLKKYGVDMKILTGDNEQVTRAVCKMVNLDIKGLVTGDVIESASEYELKRIVEENNIFVKLNPLQKVKILQVLKENGHTVGYMGDGINDAPVLRQSDVAISVANATDIAKDASDIILLEKSLLVLEKGIVQGRTIFGNILKYIKITTASNFGNTLSMIIASAWLPFLPMQPVQILFQNLIYDMSQFAIAEDDVDESFIKTPQKWRAKEIVPFALVNGPVSSIFDVATFAILGYGYGLIGDYNDWRASAGITLATPETSCDAVRTFNAGWFMEGLMTQAIVVQVLRTEKIPFIQSRATWPLNLTTVLVIGLGFLIGYTKPIANALAMEPPAASFVGVIFAILVAYMLLAQLVKVIYKKIFKVWL